jgi:uncharacterized protein (DUF1330 family)
MAAYVIGYLTVHDWERYRKYGAGFFGPLEQYGGKALMAEDNLEVLEGTAPGRHVILEFEERCETVSFIVPFGASTTSNIDLSAK